MRYASIDLETTGLDIHTDRIIELGWAIFDSKFKHPICIGSKLVYDDTYPVITDVITKITTITTEQLKTFGVAPKIAFEEMTLAFEQAGVEYLLGHNALEFDGPILSREMIAAGYDKPSQPWIDTKVDLIHFLDYEPKSTSLSYMAADHGFVNPFPHRAVFDALTCAKLLQYYPVNEIIKVANYEIIEVRALVSYDDRSKASKRGYRWDGDRKVWTKKMRSCFVDHERSQAGFQIAVKGQ